MACSELGSLRRFGVRAGGRRRLPQRADRVALLKEFAKNKKPFFLPVHQSRPHTPLVAPKKYIDMYDPAKIPDPPAPLASLKGAVTQTRPAATRTSSGKAPTPHQTKEAIAAYYACVSLVDDNVGLILEALERKGLADNTIVFILGDHGFHLGDHGYWSKYSMLEATRRAPLWVRVPGASGNGKVCREFVEFVDFMPTLGQLVGLDVPTNLEGISFAPLLANPDQPVEEGGVHGGEPEEPSRAERKYSYMTFKNGPVPEALYDLEKDPWETKNVADDPAYAKARQEMAELLKAGWKAALPKRTNAPR